MVKLVLEEAMKAPERKLWRYSSTLSLTSALQVGGWMITATPRPLYPQETEPVPIVLETGWASGPVWTGEKNLTSTRIRSRTVQPVASRYTDWAILTHKAYLCSSLYKVVQIWPGHTVTCLYTNSPGHIWTTL
jgi:hypothetical protein